MSLYTPQAISLSIISSMQDLKAEISLASKASVQSHSKDRETSTKESCIIGRWGTITIFRAQCLC
jgi:hypothetical protein